MVEEREGGFTMKLPQLKICVHKPVSKNIKYFSKLWSFGIVGEVFAEDMVDVSWVAGSQHAQVRQPNWTFKLKCPSAVFHNISREFVESVSILKKRRHHSHYWPVPRNKLIGGHAEFQHHITNQTPQAKYHNNQCNRCAADCHHHIYLSLYKSISGAKMGGGLIVRFVPWVESFRIFWGANWDFGRIGVITRDINRRVGEKGRVCSPIEREGNTKILRFQLNGGGERRWTAAEGVLVGVSGCPELVWRNRQGSCVWGLLPNPMAFCSPSTPAKLAVTVASFLGSVAMFAYGVHLSYVNIAPQQARTKARNDFVKDRIRKKYGKL
nr:bric-A-brac protein [Ipomoea batatas]